MPETILVYDIVRMLKEKQGDGTMTALADQIGIRASYLSRVMNERDDPGPAILDFLGLRKLPTVNQYEAV